MDTYLCNLDQCEVCKEKKISTNKKYGPFIDLRKIKNLLLR